jgi:hypothetical protein
LVISDIAWFVSVIILSMGVTAVLLYFLGKGYIIMTKMIITNITIDLLTRIISFNIYVPFLCRAAEIITYPRPTANPNASGINTTPPSQFSDC